ncbi:MAG: hypothetical protein EXS02_09180 [Planctomycetes bacterium]|nr:hypothetical protein [Planctomycetota bacterium]
MNARLLRASLWLLGTGVLLLPLFDSPPLQSGVYLQNVTSQSATLCKVTAEPVDLLLQVDRGAIPVARLTSSGRRHTFVVDGLASGQRYTWSIFRSGAPATMEAPGAFAALESGEICTPPLSDSSVVQFAALGDSGDQPFWVWLQQSPLWYWPARLQWLPPAPMVARIGEQIAAAQPQFVLHLGDIVYPYGQSRHYAAGFFRPFAQLLRNAPLYPVLGNHDVLDDDGRQALANFALPHGATTGDERCYSFAWGSVRVIAADFNSSLEPAAGFVHPAVLHLQRELAAATEPWIVVMSHFPIRSASRQGNRADLMLQVTPLLRDYGADLYLSGHDHAYQRFDSADEVPMVVSGAGGKSLYEVHPSPRAKVVESRYHWCWLEAGPSQLRLESRLAEGGIIDKIEFRHDAAWYARARLLPTARKQRIEALR